ncbi:MAG: haloacid dehalogenase type II [Phycisphaerales bacterium]|nr:haloacid dehalogenase type II [Phycisphaerales bacterium]
MKLPDFEALTFDCYGTLIDWERGIVVALRPWLERHGIGIDDERLLTLYSESEPRQEALTPGRSYPGILKAVFAGIADTLKVDVTSAEMETFSRSVRNWPAFPDVPEALRYLKAHYRLFIISNVDRESFAHSNAKLDVEFDAIITAQDVGSYKPDLRNFEFALRRLQEMGIERTRVLHVAQSLFHDHEPAKSMGLQTVWVNRRAGKVGTGATPAPDSDVRPDIVVEDLAGLAAMHRAQSS